MGRYLKPYRKYLVGSVLLNFFAQLMNVFSFVVLIPILNILFKIDQTVYTYREWDWDTLNKEVIVNNGYAFVQSLIAEHGAFITLIVMGVALVVMTGIKTFGYFASSAIMVPLRTGVVRDIRTELYNKVAVIVGCGYYAEIWNDKNFEEIVAEENAEELNALLRQYDV